jgi:hypothetical protein
MAWAPIELLIVAVLARLLNENGLISQAILNKHYGIGRRLEVIKDIANVASIDMSDKKRQSQFATR